MKHLKYFGKTIVFVTALIGTAVTANAADDNQTTTIVTEKDAVIDKAHWGHFKSYFKGQTFGTVNSLAGVAVIQPGMEIHPPHKHEEEEYLMVLDGSGQWHVNGKDISAKAGDMLYAKPWDIHGIKNTGDTPLKFVVWKWGTKGKIPQKP